MAVIAYYTERAVSGNFCRDAELRLTNFDITKAKQPPIEPTLSDGHDTMRAMVLLP